MASNASADIHQPIGEQVITSLEGAVRALSISVDALEHKISPFLTTDKSKVAEFLTEEGWPPYFAQLRESIFGLQALNEKVQDIIGRFPL